MSVCRIQRRENPFAQIDRSILDNPNLSWKAKGLLCYLLSKPDNWKVRTEDLVNRSTDGKTAVWSALNELKEAGHAVMEYQKDPETGLMTGRTWVIHEVPQTKTSETVGVKPSPTTAQSDTRKTEASDNPPYSNKEKNSNNHAPQGGAACFPKMESATPPSDAQTLAKLFYTWCSKNRLLIGRTKPVMHKWVEAFKDLLGMVQSSTGKSSARAYEEVHTTLLWYFANFRNRYVPNCISATTFADRYMSVFKAMQRSEGGESSQEPREVIHTEEWKGAPYDRSEIS